jgi:hypothetical protein
MQTSFMHPPFGFALFYLRGIADTLFKEKRIAKPVLSSDIYMGAIPWVLMQLILVAIVIFVPQTVTMFLPKEEKIDTDKVQIEVPADDMNSNSGTEGSGAGENPFGDAPKEEAPAAPGASGTEPEKK